jgi:RNA polymerase sigma factor (sigma-70 family)
MTGKRPESIGITRVLPEDYDYNYSLRNARIAEGYSGKELGRKVGVSCYSISMYERLRCMPSRKTQVRIAKVLGKEVSELFPEELEEYVRQTDKQRRNPKKTKQEINFVSLTKKQEGLLSYVQDFEQTVCYEELQQGVQNLLSTLPDRTREFLKLRYGFYGRKYTSKEIGSIHDVTGSYVRQLTEKTIKELRDIPEAFVLRKFIEKDRSQR